MLKRDLALAFAAGVFISIGGTVFLSCDDRYIGAVLFTVALMSICDLGLYLYTGKIGYLVTAHAKQDVQTILLTLLGNLLGTLTCGLLLPVAKPALAEKAAALCAPKLTMSPLAILITAFFCGVLMYTAVSIYREKKSPIGILFCVPVFILSGFEHSIADMFYFAASGIVSLKAFGYIWIIILGNAIGALILPCMEKVGTKESVHE